MIFPIHPRTRARLAEDGGLAQLEEAGVACIEPVPYLEFLSLQGGAGAIVTDSGGVQEEASALWACRASRSAPTPSGRSPSRTAPTCCSARTRPRSPTSGRRRTRRRPCVIPLWDGHAGDRVADVLVANYVISAAGTGSARV